MDSNNSNITTSSTGADTDHFFPTSTDFFDPLGLQPTFLDDSPTSTWPPQQQQQQTIHPSAETKTASVAAPGGPTSSRPSKKRSRASRRAPTTVLTTDTSNFRAMVQEFTGIPAPPGFASPTNYSLRFPRSISMFNPLLPSPPPPPSFLIKPPFMTNKFQPTTSATYSDIPINFQSQLLMNLPAAPPAVTVPPSSGSELSLPGVIIGQQQMDPSTLGSCKLNFPIPAGPVSMASAAAAAVAEFRNEKGSEGGRGDALLESWMCSSD